MSFKEIEKTNWLRNVDRLLGAVADGYPYRVQEPEEANPTGYIAVDNPLFEEDNGRSPFIVVELTDWEPKND